MFGEIKADPSITSEYYAIIIFVVKQIMTHLFPSHMVLLMMLGIMLRYKIMNFRAQERWRGSLAFPVDLSRENRSGHCSKIKENWASRYAQILHPSLYYSEKAIPSRKVRISMPQLQPPIETASTVTHCALQFSNNKENQTSQHKNVPKQVQQPIHQ